MCMFLNPKWGYIPSIQDNVSDTQAKVIKTHMQGYEKCLVPIL